MTDRYAVIGNPIGHSKSPMIHTEFAKQTRQKLDYVALEAPLGGFADAVDAFRREGGRGLNITAPFKLDAFEYATKLKDRARLAGATNAIMFEGAEVEAENFDGVGLRRDPEENQGVKLHGKRVLLLGAGRTARARRCGTAERTQHRQARGDRTLTGPHQGRLRQLTFDQLQRARHLDRMHRHSPLRLGGAWPRIVSGERPRKRSSSRQLTRYIKACTGESVHALRSRLSNRPPAPIFPRMFETHAMTRASKAESYKDLSQQLASLLSGETDRIANAANTSALLFQLLPDLNWAGFYFLKGSELVLGPFQGKPACVRIPIGSGVCGTAVARLQSVLVEDVHEFPGHIACDAQSRSELVVPLIRDGVGIGVIDLDSPRRARFDREDQAGIESVARLYLDASAGSLLGAA